MGDSLYIKRLKERLRQNPDSKVFLSLAEELRKKDRMDEAIAVLIDGIKKHPDFIAARLTLGRWYLLSNMLSEAQKEFSEVIKYSSDNIFAHKWLDEINKRLGIETEVMSRESEDKKQITEPTPLHTKDIRFESREIIINKLDKFLEKIKIRFGYSSSFLVPPLTHKDKNTVINRLDMFLNAIKIRFAESTDNPL